MIIDARFRFVACLLSTVIILLSSPFLLINPDAATAVEVPHSEQPLSEEGPVEVANGVDLPPVVPVETEEPLYVEDTLTNRQHYVDDLSVPGNRNILICAPDPSAWNMDIIIVASINEESGKIRLISLPRDLFINYSESLRAAIEKVNPGLLDVPGMHKINATHVIGDRLRYKEGYGRFDRPYIEFLADVVSEVLGIQIDDYVYLRTRGFRRIVDYFGGVSVNVPVRMLYEDSIQDLKIDLQPGRQLLDGFQAEGFVRFRQGYDDAGGFMNYGDLFRKRNQMQFIEAFVRQHVSLRNLSRLADISEFIGQNVLTSIQGWERIVTYGALLEKAAAEGFNVETTPLKTTEGRIGGISYVLLEERQ